MSHSQYLKCWKHNLAKQETKYKDKEQAEYGESIN